MSNINTTIAYVNNQTLTDIADAVRYKTGTNTSMLLRDIPNKIRNINGIIPSGTMEITQNGTYDVANKESVNVAINPDLQPLSVSENGSYQPDGFDGYSDVTVDVPDQYLISEWTEESEKLAFCDYWTSKIPNIDITSYVYLMMFSNNTHTNGVQYLFYGVREDTKAIAVRANAFRVIDNIGVDDKSIFDLFASAGTVVKLYRIPKAT